jgi:hypothetical protein
LKFSLQRQLTFSTFINKMNIKDIKNKNINKIITCGEMVGLNVIFSKNKLIVQKFCMSTKTLKIKARIDKENYIKKLLDDENLC